MNLPLEASDGILTKKIFNATLVKLQVDVVKSKVRLCNKLIKEAKKLREKKAKFDSLKEKYNRKADRYIEEAKFMKSMSKMDILKFVFMFTKSPEELTKNKKATIEEKALCHIAHTQPLKSKVAEFREYFPDWPSQLPDMIKSLGIKYRNKRLQKHSERGDLDKLVKREKQLFSLLSKYTNLEVNPSLLKNSKAPIKLSKIAGSKNAAESLTGDKSLKQKSNKAEKRLKGKIDDDDKTSTHTYFNNSDDEGCGQDGDDDSTEVSGHTCECPSSDVEGSDIKPDNKLSPIKGKKSKVTESIKESNKKLKVDKLNNNLIGIKKNKKSKSTSDITNSSIGSVEQMSDAVIKKHKTSESKQINLLKLFKENENMIPNNDKGVAFSDSEDEFFSTRQEQERQRSERNKKNTKIESDWGNKRSRDGYDSEGDPSAEYDTSKNMGHKGRVRKEMEEQNGFGRGRGYGQSQRGGGFGRGADRRGSFRRFEEENDSGFENRRGRGRGGSGDRRGRGGFGSNQGEGRGFGGRGRGSDRGRGRGRDGGGNGRIQSSKDSSNYSELGAKRSMPAGGGSGSGGESLLHPSWAAKKQMNNASIGQFEGKKTTFDD